MNVITAIYFRTHKCQIFISFAIVKYFKIYMARPKIAAGNWKMNTTVEEGISLLHDLLKHEWDSGISVIIAPPFTHLYPLHQALANGRRIQLSAQNCASATSGAFTGEVSVEMLVSLGVPNVIIGHSERRELFGETEEILKKKVDLVLKKALTPIFCCGEPLEIRKAGTHIAYVTQQLEASLWHLDSDDISKLVLAYEPIWAIGTGETATPEQTQEMHGEIRNFIASKYGLEVAVEIPILYGGSVKASNAREIFSKPDVDGGLVGGASLNASEFAAIINAF